MGEEIDRQDFSAADRRRFAERLAAETADLCARIAGGGLCETGYRLGFELEAWLVDHNLVPAPQNAALLAELADPYVVPELSRFNVEFNVDPVDPADGAPFSRAGAEIAQRWRACNRVAHGRDLAMLMIGTLPTLTDRDLGLDNLSDQIRYAALNREVMRHRGGAPIRLDIAGRDHLVSVHGDVMLEAAATSFQVHLKTPAALAHRHYNASIMASGPVLAVSGNAPFLFQHDLWDETRIAVFEQAVDVAGARADLKRVGFGSGYCRRALSAVFEENLTLFPPLLPLVSDGAAAEYRHLRLHNGTLWRWNRPLIGWNGDGTPHLRIEHRILAAGPSIADMMANAAFYAGLAHGLVLRGFDETGGLSFEAAKRNFYAAARHGLGAALHWPGAATRDAPGLIREVLLPVAREGLDALGVTADETAAQLAIIEARLRSGQTGAVWQRAAYAKAKRDSYAMLAAYGEGTRSGAPVHEWPV